MVKEIRKITKIGFIVCGVAILLIIVSSFFYGEKIEEPELDVHNFEISELSDEQIVYISSKFTAFMSSWKSNGQKSGISDYRYKEEEDHDITEYSSEKISGIKTVSATFVKDGTVSLEIESSSHTGNAVIVVVMDKQIVEQFDAGGTKSLVYTVEGEHEIFVKILCKEAQINIKTTRSFR